MSPSSEVLVVGGGVVGLSLARALARRGRQVRLLAAAQLGEGGASAVPMALLNPHRGRTGRAAPDDLLALATTWRWAEELRAEGLDPGAQRSGVLRLADSSRQAADWARVHGLRALGPDEAPAPYRAPHGGALVPGGGWLDPRRWTRALAASARAAGADLMDGQEVVAAERSGAAGGPGSDAWRLWTAAGQGFGARQVYLATGAQAWPAGLAAAVGGPPVFEAVAGEVWTSPLPAPELPLAGGLYLAPVEVDGVRLAAIGGGHRPPGPPAPEAAARLRRGLAWAWPALSEAEGGEPPWWGVRARLPGSGPVLLPMAGGLWWLGGFAGRGFLAAAMMAERVAGQAADAG